MNSPIMPIVNSTQLLISVTSIEEAQIALAHGADIIDLKNPSAGALGALPVEQIKAIISFVRNNKGLSKKITSATIGDLPMHPQLLRQHVVNMAATGVDIIKIGFFECDNYQACLEALATLTQAGTKLMAVLFAETSYPENLIASIKAAGFMGVMLDTAQKNGLTLLDYYSETQRRALAQKVLNCHLRFGLAGSLKQEHVAMIKALNPSYIGFRGGVCNNHQRELHLDAEKIKAIRQLL
ncbi:MAG: hypothetical protein EXR38_02150 [Methylotenera sp.]|nr:hypothetical protein [Methylotenera sp.]MSP99300.1 hypothetical protein [Methylotenera sp.]